MAIQIKDYRVLRSLLEVPYHPTLIALILWITARYSETLFTSGYRKGDKGVHGQVPCRGTDIRSRVYDNPQAVVDDINAHWKYDPKRVNMRCALLHSVGKGLHIHLQVHPNTTIKGD